MPFDLDVADRDWRHDYSPEYLAERAGRLGELEADAAERGERAQQGRAPRTVTHE